MALQLSDIYDQYEIFKDDISDVDDTLFLQWVQFVGRYIYTQTSAISADRFVKTELYSVVTPPQKENLPSDYLNMKQTDCGLYYNNTRKRSVATFEDGGDSGITFSDSGGTSAYNSNIKVQGGSSRGYTGDGAATMMLSFGTAIDWTDFSDSGKNSPTNDYVSIYVYVGNSIPTSATVEFSTSSDGSDVGVNQFSYQYTSLVEGWNRIKVKKSAFTQTGSPVWSSLAYLRVIYTGGDSTTNVYWDKLQLVENPVNANTQTDQKLGLTGYGSKKEGYYLDGSYIVLTSPSDIEDKDYVMKYIPTSPTFSALTDYFTVDGTSDTPPLLDDIYIEYLVKAVDVLYTQWDEDPNAESLADFRFVRSLGDVLDSIQRTPQVSQMYNFTNDF